MDHLAARLGLAAEAVAVTRVEPAEWRPSENAQGTEQGLDIWLIGGGRSYRYRSPLSGAAPSPKPTPMPDVT